MEKETNKTVDTEESGGNAGALIGVLFTVGVIVLAGWALVHYNPSEKEHHKAVSEAFANGMLNGYYDASDLFEISGCEYGSAGIVSWTYVSSLGKVRPLSVGACGYVFTFL